MPIFVPDAMHSDPNIRTVGSAACKYTTITAALAASSAGDIVWCEPQTYAENLTAKDGVTIYGNGSTIGTGAGPAVTCGAGHTMKIVDATLSATAAYACAAGEYLTLDGCTVSGTKTGIARVNGTWVIQSGESIATYIKSDASVITAIAVGDSLQDGNNANRIATLVTVGASNYWLGECEAAPLFGRVVVMNSTTADSIKWLPRASRKAIVLRADGHWNQANATTGSNYFDFVVTFNGATLGSWSTKNDAKDTWLREAVTINTLVDFSALDNLADATSSKELAVTATETGAQSVTVSMCLVLREVFE